jgi:hypothetical protein
MTNQIDDSTVVRTSVNVTVAPDGAFAAFTDGITHEGGTGLVPRRQPVSSCLSLVDPCRRLSGGFPSRAQVVVQRPRRWRPTVDTWPFPLPQQTALL